MLVAGVPTPSLMKYSPLPCERPEITAPLNPPDARGVLLLVTFRTAARLVKDSTRRESLLRRRLKSSDGVASEKEEIASTWDRWRESEVVDSDTVVKDSDSSGDERIGEEGRVLTTRVLYWEEEDAAEESERKRTAEKMRVFWTFLPIVVFKFNYCHKDLYRV